MVEKAIEVKDISKHYGSILALNGIDFYIGRGETIGLIGDNGAGKSTLLEILCGAKQPSNGKIFLDGERIKFKSVREANEKGIKLVYQDEALVDTMSVLDNFFIGSEETKGKSVFKWLDFDKMTRITEKMLTEFRFNINPKKNASDCSGGERRAITVLRAFKENPRILMFDEPYVGLSPRVRNDVFSAIQKISREGTSIIISSLWFDTIKDLIDRVVVLRKGEKVGDFGGSVEEEEVNKIALGPVDGN